MGCRCNERRTAIGHAAAALARGHVRAAAGNLGFVGRTLAQDLRSQATRREMALKVARMRLGGR